MQGGLGLGVKIWNISDFFVCFFFLVWNYSYLNNRYYLGLTFSSDLVPWGGARGQNLGHLRFLIFFFLLLVFMKSFVFEQKVLYSLWLRIVGFNALGWG